MSLFGQTKRHGITKLGRRSPLPIFTTDPEKKYGHSLTSPSSTSSNFFSVFYLPMPRLPFLRSSSSEILLNGNGLSSKPYHSNSHRPRRYVRICLPIPPRILSRLSRSNPLRTVFILFVCLLFGIFLLGFRKRGHGRNTWSPPFVDPNTSVLSPEEIAMIWEWEVLSGHHPSTQLAPDNIPLVPTIHNPVVPESLLPSLSSPSPLVAYHQRGATNPRTQIIGRGPDRHYIPVQEFINTNPGFPYRPTPGTIIDLDLVVEKCDFGTNKYVRDCLEYLRIGAGLDNGRRVRRGNYLGMYKHLYSESSTPSKQFTLSPRPPSIHSPRSSREPLSLPPPFPVSPTFSSDDPCDPLHPRIFHMFWAGPFTDKPYMAVMSFLFTQNLGLDRPLSEQSTIIRDTCRPQFWVWINPGPAAAVPNPSARREMLEQLNTNPWSAPFLHDRFRDVVKFKMWNTTEQLDGIPELKNYWRDMPIFNSGGNTYLLEEEAESELESEVSTEAFQPKKKKDIFEKVGSASESDYDRLSVILSDMARFVLTHRFGGIYLDADTIFLRDWEELWNYRGQFAYRWSWHQKYNTAVLKLHKGSALASFLFKTALENGLDFHPMTVSRYLKDAGLERLLFRIPDALFDPAWLNMERYQRDRPPFPYFPEFSFFFSNDKFDTAGPQPLGFDGFFRGAFSYHFHNFWWLPFDPSRNWPDLGPRFSEGENSIREGMGEKVSFEGEEQGGVGGVSKREDMDDEVDLSWSTVLKRTFEGFVRGERPNMYGEWLVW
ncbi:hypothetical protein TREMEDRAFT_43487 [Tremella mesenterica DSM 1558]|uniref:uncharacterized protein n=1 Tax=Tremella mesenterica (strain ATCC 24925 / CBS 8224 / DSM 1558 / NBRC 9311 / NRRL Y-6157 / RJB 2259-6 / UBC 559-6) TaxID=578456 RepID=UPI0003F49394|nr:uncharacterized protein TREMEDRAFT_43487 [Tremella mesenterica DSM 1558]EIW69803.1 hypothetical protein TREMEDRAFT_43487 [Tremella mesenterica DSM 1558]